MSVAKANKDFHPFLKVSQPMLDAILKEISEGAPRKHAAEANGISNRHFHNLIAQGIVDIEVGKQDTLQAKLVLSLRKIEIKEIKECRKNIRKCSKGHKGAEWTLEHVYWRWYGRNAEAKELAEEIERLRQQNQEKSLDKINC